MKVYKTVTVPARTVEECVSRACDLCGTTSDGSDWEGGSYEVNESEVKVIVKCRTGVNYPESASGQEYEIDLCPKCFVGRMLPWLKSQGAKVKAIEWEW